MTNEISVRSIGGKPADLQIARGCGGSDNRRVNHYLVRHDDVEVLVFKKSNKIFLEIALVVRLDCDLPANSQQKRGSDKPSKRAGRVHALPLAH
jgi:hypothetical protein